jgi:hypothetical protein
MRTRNCSQEKERVKVGAAIDDYRFRLEIEDPKKGNECRMQDAERWKRCAGKFKVQSPKFKQTPKFKGMNHPGSAIIQLSHWELILLFEL